MSSESIAGTFEPPYIAVIFTSEVTDAAGDDYADAAAHLEALARHQPGYLGIESVRHGMLGVTISYWRDESAVLAWRRNTEHAAVQRQGREAWYARYRVRIARVERDYGFER
jgi:heme-degrading monooxygenase HmoA